jgi:hypothetical protein
MRQRIYRRPRSSRARRSRQVDARPARGDALPGRRLQEASSPGRGPDGRSRAVAANPRYKPRRTAGILAPPPRVVIS